jgi:hypothetical protein
VDDIDILLPNQTAQHRALTELSDELVQEPECGFRNSPREKTAETEEKLVNPKVGNKQYSPHLLWKQFGEFAPRSRVNYQPGIDSSRLQQAEVTEREERLAAEAG